MRKVSELKNLKKGKISIGRVHCNINPGYIRITIVDDRSGITFAEVEMDLQSFAEALTGQGNMPMEFATRGLDKIGMQYENKFVEVFIRTDDPNGKEYAIERAVGHHEIDGWLGNRDDCKNHHNYVRKETKGLMAECEYDVYRVRYYRYVKGIE